MIEIREQTNAKIVLGCSVCNETSDLVPSSWTWSEIQRWTSAHQHPAPQVGDIVVYVGPSDTPPIWNVRRTAQYIVEFRAGFLFRVRLFRAAQNTSLSANDAFTTEAENLLVVHRVSYDPPLKLT